jgi:hypothetical protein
MDGQMMQLLRGMFAIGLTNPNELKYWSAKFGVTMDQLAETGKQATTQSVHGLRLILANRGYIRLQLPED